MGPDLPYLKRHIREFLKEIMFPYQSVLPHLNPEKRKMHGVRCVTDIEVSTEFYL